jgi:hyaluronan synthase
LRLIKILWVTFLSLGIFTIIILGYIFNFNILSISIYSLSCYGFFTLLHFFLQIIFANYNKNKWKYSSNYQPTVTIAIACYKEDSELLKKCLKSVIDQDYRNITQVILSNDGREQYIKQIFDEVSLGKKGWTYLCDTHRGKRAVMYDAFNISSGEIIVCMDSDTVIHKDAISHLVKPFSTNPSIACTTGNIGVINNKRNFLTKITDMRYWLAFNLERSAQSFFGAMSCVSGPFGAYKRHVMEKIKEEWISQKFLGNYCNIGDDRHLTNLVLSLGLKSVYVSEAKAETESPEKLLKWLKQQLRWSRSFYREFFINLKWLHKNSPWLAYDLTYQAVFPFLLLSNILVMFYLAATQNILYLGICVSSIAFFGLLRAIYGAIFTKNKHFILFIIYSFLNAFFLSPIKLYALFTLWKSNWGTQPRSVSIPRLDESIQELVLEKTL